VISVNGESYEVGSETDGLLASWLRGPLGLTGTKLGCGEGECGACTVLVDGAPVLSCRTSVRDVIGAAVTTIEGLAVDGRLHPMQQALIDEHASQCGYCTPGMVLRAAALLETDPDPDDDRIAISLEPNLCRCGCYSRIEKSVHRGAALRHAGGPISAEDGMPALAALLAEMAPPSEMAPLTRPRRPWDLTRPEERDHLEVLGPGLVCVWPPPAGAPGPRRVNGGAWIHLSPSGRVTAFSGKVDVGQDNRTAFQLLVAEELGVAFDRVSVVEGDTDICPFDVGTYGSRSMPDTGEALRRAAAGARQVQIDIGGVEQLTGTCRLVVLDAEPTLVASAARRLVGRSGHEVSRLDAVTGRRQYVSDLVHPGMLHGAMLRPSVPGSSLRSFDASAATRMDGVTVVEDGSFIGVTAEDPTTARRAVAAIVAEWDQPPSIDDDLVGYLRDHTVPGEGWERAIDDQDGDVDGALASATHLLTATYTTAYLAHVPLETRVALAEWSDDRLTVWTGSQVPFGVRAYVAGALDMDEVDVRVIVAPTGGAFGGKHGGEVASEAARLSRAVGRPVKVHWSRVEEFRWGTLRPLAVIDVRAGLDAGGSLVAWDFLDINAGPAALGLPYAAESHRLRSQPAHSPLHQGSYRALGANANNFARECAIDELVHGWGGDPLSFRLDHLDDDRLVTVLRIAAERFGWTHVSPLGGTTARDGAARAPLDAARTGSGLAVGLEKGGRVATCAEVSVGDDDTVRVIRVVTAYECGTVVNRDTVVNQIEGATMMALGGALFEAVPVEHGRFVDPSLANYRVPRFGDMPEIEVVLVDRPDLPSAGAGETPMIAVAPAISNAVFAATGRRRRDLPLMRTSIPSSTSPIRSTSPIPRGLQGSSTEDTAGQPGAPRA